MGPGKSIEKRKEGFHDPPVRNATFAFSPFTPTLSQIGPVLPYILGSPSSFWPPALRHFHASLHLRSRKAKIRRRDRAGTASPFVPIRPRISNARFPLAITQGNRSLQWKTAGLHAAHVILNLCYHIRVGRIQKARLPVIPSHRRSRCPRITYFPVKR